MASESMVELETMSLMLHSKYNSGVMLHICDTFIAIMVAMLVISTMDTYCR